ncbi:unnamed protein product [Pleuronectes platessa]|uniref:Uncharacterized protein n=1 Tax=Pleuronectes platessa TaxID=8262 RepID=A0A9N7YUM6_PLEPL|nr:unnamed protein product [Pleuronectes platessa]
MNETWFTRHREPSMIRSHAQLPCRHAPARGVVGSRDTYSHVRETTAHIRQNSGTLRQMTVGDSRHYYGPRSCYCNSFTSRPDFTPAGMSLRRRPGPTPQAKLKRANTMEEACVLFYSPLNSLFGTATVPAGSWTARPGSAQLSPGESLCACQQNTSRLLH